jgi:hypothetical protein
MNPLDKLNAVAARIVQEAESVRGNMGVRLKESAAQIRGAVATIRAALEEAAPKAAKPGRLRLILGDENHG